MKRASVEKIVAKTDSWIDGNFIRTPDDKYIQMSDRTNNNVDLIYINSGGAVKGISKLYDLEWLLQNTFAIGKEEMYGGTY